MTSETKQLNLLDLLLKLKEWFVFLLGKWKIIVLVGIVGGAAGFGYATLGKPVYTATLTFAMEEDESSSLGGALGLASQLGFDLGTNGGGAFAGPNIMELFKSRNMVEKALMAPVTINKQTISLAEFYIRNMKWRDKWAKEGVALKDVQFLAGANRITFSRAQDSLLGLMYANLVMGGGLNVFQKDREVHIVTLQAKSANEEFARYFAEALANEVSSFYINTKNHKAKENVDILQKQVDSIRTELNASITGVAAATDDVFSLNPALNIKRAPSSRRQVDVQANTAMLVELIKQLELAKIALRKETPLIQIIDRPTFPLKKEKFGRVKGTVLFGFVAVSVLVFFLVLQQALSNHVKQKQVA